MPKRMLRDWTDSLRFDGLSSDAERLFTRLIMKADDFGRFHAEPRLVRAACFPLMEKLSLETVLKWMTELVEHRLISCYKAKDGKYLVIPNFGQRLQQSNSRFPEPSEENGTEQNSTVKNGESPPEEKRREVEEEAEEASPNGSPLPFRSEVVNAWNEMASTVKLPSCRLTDARKQALATRSKDPWWVENYTAAIAKIPTTPFLLGTNDRRWRADFDFFIRPDTVTKIMEGKYQNAPIIKKPFKPPTGT